MECDVRYFLANRANWNVSRHYNNLNSIGRLNVQNKKYEANRRSCFNLQYETEKIN